MGTWSQSASLTPGRDLQFGRLEYKDMLPEVFWLSSATARVEVGSAPSSFKAGHLFQETHHEHRGAQMCGLESSKVTLKSQVPIYSLQEFFFKCGPFLKPLLNFYNTVCIMFWFCGWKASEILAPQQGIEPAPPVLESKVLTTGLPGKSLSPI